MIYKHPPTEGEPKAISDRTQQAEARLCRIARGDCIHGGARALRISKRAASMRFIEADFEGVVGSQYHLDWNISPTFGAIVCDECGQTHQGVQAAHECCAD
ncbi:MAG: hypothetical protein ACYTF7_11370 [Planctomycetota bacterium]|jgi:hypothetical protein